MGETIWLNLKSEIFILMGILIVLFIGMFQHFERSRLLYIISQMTLCLALYFLVSDILNANMHTYDQVNMVFDQMAQLLKICMVIGLFIIFLYSREVCWKNTRNIAEHHALILSALLGMMVLVSSKNFLSFYLGIELFALPLYAVIAMCQKELSIESAMKYFILSGLTSALLLLGISILYGLTGSLDINEVSQLYLNKNLSVDLEHVYVLGCLLVFIAVAFKFGLVPFHTWVPDVYQGSPGHVLLFIGSLPKIVAFSIGFRILNETAIINHAVMKQALLLLAILSIMIGNLLALLQNNIKRLLAYSSISHMGFIALGFAVAANQGFYIPFFYTLSYVLIIICILAIVMLQEQYYSSSSELSNYKGLSKQNPILAFTLMILLFALAGIPPFLGFYSKVMVINALIEEELYIYAIIALILSVIGAFYYLRVIWYMYFEALPKDNDINYPNMMISLDGQVILTFHMLLLIVLSIYPMPLIYLCNQAFFV